jgi:hypothetical protein
MYYLWMLEPVCRDKQAYLTGWTYMPCWLLRTFRRDFKAGFSTLKMALVFERLHHDFS